MRESACFVFRGRLRTESFVEFARHRAARLCLGFEVGPVSSDAVALHVSGAAELVDAFEMACSLGPYDCLVLDVARYSSGMAA